MLLINVIIEEFDQKYMTKLNNTYMKYYRLKKKNIFQ
jgi:hypothetical protein